MTGRICQCFPCFRKEKRKWNLSVTSGITSYDVIYIEVPEKEKVAFEERRPAGRELSLSEYMGLYSYVTESKLPQPFYNTEYECYYFINGDRIVFLQGWVPQKRSPWMRHPLTRIPRDKISLIGKFKEPKGFGPAERYEVKEHSGKFKEPKGFGPAGKFKEPKGFGPAERYEVKEHSSTDAGKEKLELLSSPDSLINKLRKQNRPRSPNFSKLFQ